MQIFVAVRTRIWDHRSASAEDLRLNLSDSISDALSSVRYPIRDRLSWDRGRMPEFIARLRHPIGKLSQDWKESH